MVHHIKLTFKVSTVYKICEIILKTLSYLKDNSLVFTEYFKFQCSFFFG